jgi:hypothetical protein
MVIAPVIGVFRLTVLLPQNMPHPVRETKRFPILAFCCDELEG